eukprot:m.335425 g.335425  ORF g.335425 m.335425 type:complete len:429 (-) comp17591_c0_seq1:105-1391(-)
MDRVLVVALLVSLCHMSQAKPVNTFADLCNIPKEGTHPAVDLSALKGTKDYSVPSYAAPSEVYKFQLCGELEFQDSVCTKGASVCEVFVNDTGREVYGFSDSIKLQWMEDSDVLEMIMTGNPSCKKSPTLSTTTKFFFTCDKDATTPKISLKDESELGCFVEIDIATDVLCGGSGGDLYKCADGKCVESAAGIPKTQCEAVCEGPDEDQYECNGGKCSKTANGPFPSQEKCMEDCALYACVGGECVPKEGGSSYVSCLQSCPADTKYSCVDKKCVEDEKGTSKETCEADCDKDVLYDCEQDQCVVTTNGKGVNKTVCEALCGGGADKKYHCVNEVCEETTGTGTSKELCEASCEKPPERYKCTQGQCEPVTGGGGVDKEDCEKLCGGGGSDLYMCVQGTCEKSQKGVEKSACEAVCEKQRYLPDFLEA